MEPMVWWKPAGCSGSGPWRGCRTEWRREQSSDGSQSPSPDPNTVFRAETAGEWRGSSGKKGLSMNGGGGSGCCHHLLRFHRPHGCFRPAACSARVEPGLIGAGPSRTATATVGRAAAAAAAAAALLPLSCPGATDGDGAGPSRPGSAP